MEAGAYLLPAVQMKPFEWEAEKQLRRLKSLIGLLALLIATLSDLLGQIYLFVRSVLKLLH